MPRGTRRLPEYCLDLISRADALIHAGDFVRISVLEELESVCPVIHAVHGNVDEPALQRSLPETLELDLAGEVIGLVHDAGPARGRLPRLRRRFPGAAAVIFGHSHFPLREESQGFQIFNPGSPTERRRAPQVSMGLIHPSDGGLGFEHVWL